VTNKSQLSKRSQIANQDTVEVQNGIRDLYPEDNDCGQYVSPSTTLYTLANITPDVKETSQPVPASAMFLDDTTPTPQLTKPTQALVRIKAFGLNRMDLMQRHGVYPLPPQAPKTMGVEFSGTIVQMGPGSEDASQTEGEKYKVGDEVFGLAYGGAYAQYIAVSTHMLVPKPKELSFVECAGIPETWITAIQALYLVGGFEPGKSVLWHAGASGVSIAGIQLTKMDNAKDGKGKVFATTRSDEKCRWVEETLGADLAVNSTEGGWSKKIIEASNGGEGVDIVVDFIGGPILQDNIDMLCRDGRIVCLAALGGTKVPAGLDIGSFWRKRVRIEGSSLRSRDEAYQGNLRNLLVEHALPKFVDGTFKIVIEKELDWKNIVEAHELMESNKTKGKIVCTIP
jgi:NADPH:quinone reductase-like Zn-dependent oxidoreductase